MEYLSLDCLMSNSDHSVIFDIRSLAYILPDRHFVSLAGNNVRRMIMLNDGMTQSCIILNQVLAIPTL